MENKEHKNINIAKAIERYIVKYLIFLLICK